MNELLFAIWFFLPAGLSNGSPVIANKVPVINRWNTPLDFGKSWRGKRIFGDNKTWRGLVVGSLTGGFTSLITYYIYPQSVDNLSLHIWSPAFSMFLVGFALGAGALIGDAVESFCKRRAGVKPGHTWFPFDQTDYIIGGLIFVSPFVNLSLQTAILILATWFGMHLIFAYLFYLLGFKDKPI